MKWMTHRFCWKLLVTLLIATSCGQPDHSSYQLESIESPLPGMKPGRGFDSFSQEPVRGDCFTHLSDKLVQTQPEWGRGSESKLSEYYIRDHEDLMSQIGLDAGLKFRNIFYSVLPKFRGLDQFKRSKDALTWLYSIRITTREDTLDRLGISDLNVQAKKLLEDKKFEAFRIMCGTHYVRSVRYGGEFFRIYEIDSKNVDLIRQIKSEIAGNYQILEGDLSLKSGFKQAILESSLRQESLQTGGRFQIEASDPVALRNQVKKWAKSLNEPYIRAFELELADWQTIIPEMEVQKNSAQQQFTLMNYYHLYRKNLETLFEIDSVLNPENQRTELGTQEYMNQLNQVKQAINQQQNQILHSGKQCFSQADQCSDTYQPIQTPKIRKKEYLTLTLNDGYKEFLVPSNQTVRIHLQSDPGRSQIQFSSDGKLFCKIKSEGGKQHEKNSFWPCGKSGSRGITTKLDTGMGLLEVNNLSDRDTAISIRMTHRGKIDWEHHLFLSGLFVFIGGAFMTGWA